MTAAERYDSANIAANVAAAGMTEIARRNRDESEGRTRRLLSDRCAKLGLDLAIIQQSVIGRTSYRVAITNPRTGARIAEYSGDVVEALDKVADRLAREDFDR